LACLMHTRTRPPTLTELILIRIRTLTVTLILATIMGPATITDTHTLTGLGDANIGEAAVTTAGVALQDAVSPDVGSPVAAFEAVASHFDIRTPRR
jgi:hypothetical protein